MTSFKNIIKIACISLCVTLTSCKAQYPDLEDGIYAEFITSKGNMLAKLAYDKTPITVANFVSLAEGTNTMADSAFRGKKFYNGLIFHRVMDKFMIQGGDPEGTGRGNPGFKFNDEFHPDLKHDTTGVLSMANSGPNSNGSQFFITEVPKPHLDNKHSVFGKLVLGLDVLDTISNVKVGSRNKPITDVVIDELNIIRKGKAAKKFDASNIFINHFAEVERKEKERKAKAKTIIETTKKKFNQQQEKATTLPSGLQFLITEKGSGEKLKETDKVSTHYTVYFEDGRLLDTSKLEIAETLDAVNKHKKAAGAYQPLATEIGPNAPMIAGFKEGLQQLSVGDKATLFIPYHLGFGEAGRKGVPSKSNLIFEVEVIRLLK